MRYKPISSNDSINELEAKLRNFGYPYDVYRRYIGAELLVDRIFFNKENMKKINEQIRRLERLKKSTLSKVLDIYTEIALLAGSHERLEEPKTKLANIELTMACKTFSNSIDNFINRFNMKKVTHVPKKRGAKTIDFIIAAVLSLVIRDSRGARWKDIYELLRWFKKNVEGPERNWLHVTEYSALTLEEESKYIKKKYKSYIESKREEFFPLKQ